MMDFGLGTYALGFIAGTVSVLSPCVLPLLPILVASALSKHRLGAAALALGLGLSFAAVGIFLATLGASIGLDAESLRRVAAGMMVMFGFVMLSGKLQHAFVRIVSRVSSTGQQALDRVGGDGLASQFAIGLLLGFVWSPCVGPTLGAATTLAAQGQKLGHIAALMLAFGLGAGLPLTLVGVISRASLARMRGALAAFGAKARWMLGLLFVALGGFVLSGADRHIEAAVLAISPAWLTTFTTSI
jgi:cytochrome c-type biogenesis protein